MFNEGEHINGSGHPIVKIFNGFTLVETMNFPIPDKEGLIEDPQPDTIDLEFWDGEKFIITRGYRILWNISYKAKIIRPHSLAIGRLYDYQKNNFKIVLIPRSNASRRGFTVNFMNKSMPFGILKGGIKARGNRGMFLLFETKYLEQSLNWINPDEIPSWTYEMNETNTIF